MYCSTVSEKILACGTWKKQKIAKGILELANARQSCNFLNLDTSLVPCRVVLCADKFGWFGRKIAISVG